jgi:hypothetical protein
MGLAFNYLEFPYRNSTILYISDSSALTLQPAECYQ